MKRVSKAAGRTLDILRDRARENDNYIKIDKHNHEEKGHGIMPVSVEMLNRNGSAEVWAVGHWYTMNGDACRDPEVVFLRHPGEGGAGVWYPIEYRQDTPPLNIHQELVTLDGALIPKTWSPKQQPSVAGFCHTWMNNVRHQQELTA